MHLRMFNKKFFNDLTIVRMKRFLILLWIFIMLSAYHSQGQTFEWQADIPQPEKSGFYKIYLHPQITSKLQRHYPDIRIYNSRDEEIPFLYDADKKMSNPDSTEKLTIIENKHRLLKSHTSVIIKNDSLKTVDNFAFLIDNSGIRKWIKILAGENTKDWYAVKDNFPVQAAYSDSSKTELLISNIPAGNFPYYRIIFYDYNNQAVNVHKAYTYSAPLAQQNYARLPETAVSHNDTLNRTVVKLSFEKSQYIDRLEFDIEGPRYFFRNAVLEKPGGRHEGENKLFYDEVKKEIQLSSDRENVFNLSHYKAKEIKLTIDNRNNPPLRIKRALAYQQKSYLIAYLSAGESHRLLFGNRNVDFPVYDLEYFKDKIPQNPRKISIKSLKKIGKQENSLFSSAIWNMPVHYLWIGMGITGIFLLYITGKMVWAQYRNRGKQKTDNSA